MISAKLVHRIEDHWEQVSARFFRLMRSSQDMPHFARLPESELTEVCRRVLRNLGNWLVSGSESDIAWIFERIGAERHRSGIPLSEAIRVVQLLKDATVSFIQDEGPVDNSVQLYAEEELENQLGRFFDLLVFHLARGYESTALPPLKVAAAPGHGA
jgi:hypothetical protein